MSISKEGITIADSFPKGATGFLSISFTKKIKDNPMAKYIVGAVVAIAIAGILSYSPEAVNSVQVVLNFP